MAAPGLVDAAAAGVGFTQTLLYQAAPAIADGRLRIVLADHQATPLPLSIVRTGQSQLPLKARTFLDFAAPRLIAELARIDALVDGARGA